MKPEDVAPNDVDTLARDLILRTERAVRQVAETAVDTGITFRVSDIVDAVERDLPSGYPAATAPGAETRRDMISRMAQDILSGEMYD